MKDLRFMVNQAQTVLELTKGFTPKQRDNFSNALLTAEEMASYVLELDQQNSQLSEALKQAKEALENECDDEAIQDIVSIVRAHDFHKAQDLIKHLFRNKRNALDTINKLGL